MHVPGNLHVIVPVTKVTDLIMDSIVDGVNANITLPLNYSGLPSQLKHLRPQKSKTCTFSSAACVLNYKDSLFSYL